MPDQLDPSLDELAVPQQPLYPKGVREQQRVSAPIGSMLGDLVKQFNDQIGQTMLSSDPTRVDDPGAYGTADLARQTLGAGYAGAPLRRGLGIFGSQPLTTWHASPHSFKKFDISKIGTGEGVQAYGRGLYSAESPSVSGRGGYYDMQFTMRKLGRSSLDNMEKSTLKMMGQNKSDDEIIQSIKTSITDPRYDETTKDAIARSTVKRMNDYRSHVYKVLIDTHPDELFDWDDLLKNQSPLIQDAIGYLWNKQKLPGNPFEMNGGELYKKLTDAIEPRFGSPTAAQEVMRQFMDSAGIPGIKYLDQFSRFSQATIDGKKQSLARLLQIPNSPTKNAMQRVLEKEIARMEERLGKRSQNVVIHNSDIMSIAQKLGIAGILGGAAAGTQDAQNPQ
jgi:hypothetical protein